MTVQMLPAEVLSECRQQADDWMAQARTKPRRAAGAAMVIAIWIGVGLAVSWWLSARFNGGAGIRA